MKVIFLDIDGVLNRGLGPLDPAMVARLNRITAYTSARIVVHSSWRYRHSLDRLRAMLAAEGVRGEVLDVAPMPVVRERDWGGWVAGPEEWAAFKGDLATDDERAIAIQRWLDAHPEVDRFIILDDSPALGHFVGRPEFMQTLTRDGLTGVHVGMAARMLGKVDDWGAEWGGWPRGRLMAAAEENPCSGQGCRPRLVGGAGRVRRASRR